MKRKFESISSNGNNENVDGNPTKKKRVVISLDKIKNHKGELIRDMWDEVNTNERKSEYKRYNLCRRERFTKKQLENLLKLTVGKNVDGVFSSKYVVIMIGKLIKTVLAGVISQGRYLGVNNSQITPMTLRQVLKARIDDHNEWYLNPNHKFSDPKNEPHEFQAQEGVTEQETHIREREYDISQLLDNV